MSTTGFKQPCNYGFYRVVSDHLHKRVRFNASYLVHILETLQGNDRTARNVFAASMTSRWMYREKKWMLKLRTVYPSELHNLLGDWYKIEYTHVLEGNEFSLLPRKYDRVFRGSIHKNKILLFSWWVSH